MYMLLIAISSRRVCFTQNISLLCQAHEICDRAHAELLHHSAAVHLDGFLDRSEIAGDLLVKAPGDDVAEYFTLARRQGLDLCPNRGHFGMHFAKEGILVDSARDGVEQNLVAHGLGEKV